MNKQIAIGTQTTSFFAVTITKILFASEKKTPQEAILLLEEHAQDYAKRTSGIYKQSDKEKTSFEVLQNKNLISEFKLHIQELV